MLATDTPVLLMEGGPSRGDATHLTKTLRTKMRLFSLFFGRVLVHSSDYIESTKLPRLAREESALWEKTGTVRILLPNDVGDLRDYVNRRVVPGRRPVDRGRRPHGEPRDERLVARDAHATLAELPLSYATVTFDIDEMRRQFRANSIGSMRRAGLHRQANLFSRKKDFYRGLVLDAVEELPSASRSRVLSEVNGFYYMAAADQARSSCAFQRQYVPVFRDLFASHLDAGALEELAADLDIEYWRFVQHITISALRQMEIPQRKLLSMDSERFAEIATSYAARRWRKKMRQLVTIAAAGSISEGDCDQSVELFLSAFSDAIVEAQEHDRAVGKRHEWEGRILGIVSLLSGLSVVQPSLPTGGVPLLGLLGIGVSVDLLRRMLKPVLRLTPGRELSLFADRWRTVVR